MKCSDCIHWEQSRQNYEEIEDDIRVCFKAKELWNCTEWIDESTIEYSKFERKLTAEYKDQMVFVQDGSSYSARMLTRGDFFCAHFEDK